MYLGLWEFVRRGDPPVMGITPLKNGVTEEFLRRPRRAVPLPSPTAVAQAP